VVAGGPRRTLRARPSFAILVIVRETVTLE